MKNMLPRLSIALITLAGCHRPDTLFLSLPASRTHIDFVNTPVSRPGLGILQYIYYYNGGGVAIGDINKDGLPDIYFTANTPGQNKLYLNKGNFEFEDITQKAGVGGSSDWCTGVTMADVNGDGLLDIYVCALANMHGFKGHNELFINNGNGTFTEQAKDYGLDFAGYSTQAVFFDYDHDGDLDCYLLNQSEHPNQHIVDTSHRRIPDVNAGDRLYRNGGRGRDQSSGGLVKFTDVSAQTGIYQSSLGYGLGIAVGDLNDDGWEDIYVGNDFHENDYYYINNGDGTFTEGGAAHFRHYSRYSMGNDIADFDNDGQLDIVTADMLPGDEKILKTYGNGEHLDVYDQKIVKNGFQHQYSRNCLQKNNGDGVSFSEVGLIGGVAATDWSWSPLFADFDNDGNKDLLISSGIVKRPLDLDFIMYFSNIGDPRRIGNPAAYEQALLEKMPDGASHPYLFKGDGYLHFKDMSEAWGTSALSGYFNGAAYADLDNDGRLDIVVNALNGPAVILANHASRKDHLTVAFQGEGMNTSGIGVKAYLFSAGHMQYEQLMLTRGFMSSCEPRLHFGLDSIGPPDSLLVVWPDGRCQVIRKPAANQQLVCRQQEANKDLRKEAFFPKKKLICEDVSKQMAVGWKHEEDAFNDFNRQYLIPHLESTRGPVLAVGDVNKDGLDDLFVCGGKGQPGCLMIQTGTGRFLRQDTAVLAVNKEMEGVGAVFFDANNDGYPDLYVVSGGNEYADGDPRLADHLYLNDGRGHLKEAMGSLPALLANKSCVAAADVNGDGKTDLFVGSLAAQKNYGTEGGTSWLLLNEGNGKFVVAGEPVISLQGMNRVISAVFADLNHDGWADLALAGEWMGVQLFLNDHGVFRRKEIKASTGLWQTLYAEDVNGDGYADLLAGNWGHNSKLFAGRNGPLKLYVKDFDGNGTVEQIMAYTTNGQEYPFLGKDQLELALPALKKNNLRYDAVAGRSVQFLLGDMFSGCRELKAETLGSSCFMNDGKGNFSRMDLPDDLQLAPIFTFVPYPIGDRKAWLSAGNFYGVLPYEGRYDAMLPSIFGYKGGAAGFSFLSGLPFVSGEVRDAKWISCAQGKRILVLARNNDALIFLKPG